MRNDSRLWGGRLSLSGLFRQFAELPQGRRADAQQAAHFAGAFYDRMCAEVAVKRGGDGECLADQDQPTTGKYDGLQLKR